MNGKLGSYTARLWILVGVLGLGFVTVFAANHFVFGMPMYLGNIGALATTWQIAGLCAVLAVGFCSIAVMGAYRLTRRSPPREMGQGPASAIDRVSAVLYWPALTLAWVDAVLVPASAVGLPRFIPQGALWTTAALAAVHFVFMLFDGPTHRAVNAYNAMALERATKRLPQQDPFGSLKHGPLLKLTIIILGGEMMLAMLAQGWSQEPSTLALLAFSAAFLIGIVGMLQMKTVTLPAEGGRSGTPAV